MNNFDHAIEATETALNSTGSATRENTRYMEGLEAKTQAVKASFEQLANTVIDSGLVKAVLDLVKGFLDLSNNGIGTFIIQASLLTGVLWGGTGLIKAMKLIPVFFAQATASIGGFAGVLSLTAPQLALIAAGIVGVVAVGTKMHSMWMETHPTLEMIEEDLQGLNNELQTNKSRLEELESIPWSDRTTAQRAEIERIKEENEVLLENIRLKNQLKAETWSSTSADTPTQYTAYEYAYDPRMAKYTEELEKIGSYNTREELIQVIKANEKLAEGFENGAIKIREFNEEISNIDYVTRLTQELDSLNDKVNRGETLTADQKARYQELVGVLGTYLSELDNMNDGTTLEVSGLKDVRDALEETLAPAINIVEQQNAISRGYQLTAKQAENLTSKYPELSNNIVKVGEALYIERNALIELSSATEDLGVAIIDSQTNATLTTKTAVRERLNYLRLEIEAVKGTAMEFSDYYWELVNAEQGIINALAEISANRVDIETNIDTGNIDSTISKEKTLIDVLKEELEILDHQAFLAEKNGEDQLKLVKIYEQAQKRIHAVAEEYRKKGYTETSAEIRELQKLWWDYADEIDAVYQDIAEAQEKAAEEAKKAWEEAQQALIDDLNDKKNAYETAFGYMADQIQKEIDALEDQRDAEEEFWDAKIEALEAQNDEIERQIELEELQEQLARAKQGRVLVYKDGRFQYVQNVEEISEAEKNLESYEREEALRQETENLEQLKDQALASIDEQIEAWEKYKEEWSSVVDDYQEEQDRLLAEQVLGIELEGENWKTRLDNLADYVAQYKALMAQLTEAQNATYEEQVPVNSGGISDGGGGSLPSDDLYYDEGGSTAWIPGVGNVHVDIENGHTVTEGLPPGTIISPGGSSGKWEITGVNPDGSYQSKPVSKNASGTLSAKAGVSLVGEQGPELRVLNSGDGIIPADLTRNLMDIGKFSVKEILGGNSSVTYNSFDKLVLPNVTDFNSFITAIKQFRRFAYQQ